MGAVKSLKTYTEMLALLDEKQLVFEVGARLKAFNDAEAVVLRKVERGGQPTIDDWIVIDEARGRHRLAERELAKRRERK